MSATYEETLNRFPLRGIHLHVLATGTPHVQNRQTGLLDATSRRAIQDLRSWRILRRNPDDRREFLVDDRELQQAVFAASQERSDLFQALEHASALQVLAALPTTGSPRTFGSTGLSRPTIRTQLARLHERNLIQRQGGDAALNPDLPGLQRLVLAYRDLQTRWMDEWSTPTDPRSPATYLAIHQRGVETAWRLRGADIQGPHIIDWDQPFFRPLAPVHDIAIHGPREITTLDEALLLVRAEADLDFREALTPHGVQAQDPRILGLLAAGLCGRSLQRRSVESAFAHYHLHGLHKALASAFRRNEGPVMVFRERYLHEFNVEEDCLA